MSAVLRFILLAYGISWLVAFPLTFGVSGDRPVGLPSYLMALAALGPLTAAWVMHRSAEPAFRFRDMYRRRSDGGVARLWTVLLAATPLLFLALALGAETLFGAGTPGIVPLRAFADPAVVAEFVIVCVVYGFAEEPAWRGWLLPRLQTSHNAMRSTLIVAVIWAVWHSPFLVPGYRTGGAGSLFVFFLGLLAATFWLTFLFNSTGGSVIAASVWHMLWNAATLIARPSTSVRTWLGALLAITGFGAALIFGRRAMSVGGKAVTATAARPARALDS